MDLPNSSIDLHDSILIEILVKLPLKSVITCKLVCKYWYRLISDSSFAQAYNSAEPFKCSLYFESKSLYLNETGRENLETSFNLKLHLPTNKNDILLMVGSCNGMCCFQVKTILPDKFYLYNPLTCEYIEIPERGRVQSDVFRRMSFGFGCSKYRNQYKVVRFLSEMDRRMLGSRIQGQVFTIGVDSTWREFEGRCIDFTLFKYSVLFNEVLHWVGFDLTCPTVNIIYAFDVEEEKSERIELPLALQSLENDPCLGILNDHLCAVEERDYFRVWIMKDYGVVESWTKYTFVKDPIPRHSFLWYPGFVCNVASHAFAEEVEDFDSRIFARNGEKEHMIIGRHCRRQALPYVPCFSSLNDVLRGGNLRVRKI